MKHLVLACLVVCREGCLMGCQEGCQVECLVGCPMEKPAVPAVQDPQLKKSTKLDLFKSRIFCNMFIYLGCIYLVDVISIKILKTHLYDY